MENRETDVLKNFRDKTEISIEQYKESSPSGSRSEIMYGSAKVHKIVTDGLPSFRPILSAINTPTYKLAKFLVPMLEPLATNEYTIKDSFLCKKQLTSALKIYLTIGLMLIICQKTLFVSCLLGPCLNHLSYLIRNSINSMMELQWVPH